MLRVLSVFVVAAAAGSTASASVWSLADADGVRTLDGQLIRAVADRGGPFPTSNFTVYSGVTNAGGSLFLLEDSVAPARDDIVTLGNANEQINDYVAAAGGVLRFVTSSTGPGNIPGQTLITIALSGRDVTGAPADLWPTGFSGGNPAAPLTGGGIGVGLNLGALLGNQPLNIAPENFVVAGSIELVTDGASSGAFGLPLTFFGPSSSNWNGRIGISLGNGAGLGVTSDIVLRVLVAPSPGAGTLLGLAGLVAMRRRR